MTNSPVRSINPTSHASAMEADGLCLSQRLPPRTPSENLAPCHVSCWVRQVLLAGSRTRFVYRESPSPFPLRNHRPCRKRFGHELYIPIDVPPICRFLRLPAPDPLSNGPAIPRSQKKHMGMAVEASGWNASPTCADHPELHSCDSFRESTRILEKRGDYLIPISVNVAIKLAVVYAGKAPLKWLMLR